MRYSKTFLSFLLVLAGALVALDTHAAGWVTHGASGTTQQLNDIKVIVSTGYAVGAGGTVLKTTDQGASWVPKPITGVSAALHSVDFLTNGQTVWVVGASTARRSTTGGDSWLSAAPTAGVTYYGVDFVNSTIGYRVGSGLDGVGVLQKSTDGGISWGVPQTIPAGTMTLRDVSCVTTTVCWAVGNGGRILSTTNGTAWTIQSLGTTQNLYDVHAQTTSSAWVVGDLGVIRRTTNGSTWTNPTTETFGSTNLRGIDILGQTGWVVGEDGVAYQTSDTGVTWTPVSSGRASLEAVEFLTAAVGWAVGASGTIRRWDGQLPFAPADLTRTTANNDNTPTFTWTAAFDDVEVIDYQYQIDGAGAWTSTDEATTVTITTPVADGTHTLAVRARDRADNLGPSSSVSFAIDATPPSTPANVTRTSHISDTTPTFTWDAATDAVGVASYDVRIVSVGGTILIDWTNVGNVLTYTVPDATPLPYVTPPTTYVFYARAVDTGGNIGSAATQAFSSPFTPASTVFDTRIVSGPAAASESASATFTFDAPNVLPDAVYTFECSLDGAVFAACISPRTVSGLSSGEHGFRVRTVNQQGTPDPTPAVRDWEIELAVAPDTVITSAPTSGTTSRTSTFTFGVAAGTPIDGIITFECQLDSAPFAACTSPMTYNGDVSIGMHTFRVRAVRGGVADLTPASHTWTIAAAEVNNTPNPPSGLSQHDSITPTGVSPAWAVGVTDDDEAVIFQATASDPDAGQLVRLEVEARLVGAAFSGLANVAGSLGAQGVHRLNSFTSGLVDGSYHWQARVVDAAGVASAWGAFGGNAESVADFTIVTAGATPGAAPGGTPPGGATGGEPVTPAGLLPAGFAIGDLVKLADDGNSNTFGDSAVFYLGANGGRYVFTNDKAYFTWYADFSPIRTISTTDLAAIPLRGNVTYRPGVKMIKLQTSPTVYVVTAGGVLRAVPSEAIATALHGVNWNQQIDDINDAFWTNYTVGTPLVAALDFNRTAVRDAATTISLDRGLVTP